MRQRTVRQTWQVVLSAALIGLIALSVAATEGLLAAVVVFSILALVAIFRAVFPSGRAFCITLANLVGVYACLFQFFVESNFRDATPWALSAAFVLPARAITFPEGLYFSLMTLSTVGYGDIAPATSGIRVIAAAEIVAGILLLLFGFNEIFSFARRREQLHQRRPDEDGRALDR